MGASLHSVNAAKRSSWGWRASPLQRCIVWEMGRTWVVAFEPSCTGREGTHPTVVGTRVAVLLALPADERVVRERCR
jgi:hypothetical protein